jgi:hypothetical protein
MSHFAKVLYGKVTQVIVAEPEFFNTFLDSSPGEWIQTSYNTRGGEHPENKPLRGNFAGIGFIYDYQNDVFYPPKPVDKNKISCDSWTISAPKWTWTPPSEMPKDDKIYAWNESTLNWDLIS